MVSALSLTQKEIKWASESALCPKGSCFAQSEGDEVPKNRWFPQRNKQKGRQRTDSTGPFIFGMEEGRARTCCLEPTNVWIKWKPNPLLLLQSKICYLTWQICFNVLSSLSRGNCYIAAMSTTRGTWCLVSHFTPSPVCLQSRMLERQETQKEHINGVCAIFVPRARPYEVWMTTLYSDYSFRTVWICTKYGWSQSLSSDWVFFCRILIKIASFLMETFTSCTKSGSLLRFLDLSHIQLRAEMSSV